VSDFRPTPDAVVHVTHDVDREFGAAPVRRPVRLDDFGDVMTDRDLVALMQWKPSTPRARRDKAKQARISPNLPARIDDRSRDVRYRKVDVEHWLKTGSSARVQMRRSA